MPSLHKRPESPYWIASFTDAKGRRLKKSTKTTNRTLAMRIAQEWEKAARAARAKQLVESQCRRVLSELHQQATGAPLHFISCSDWFAQWLAGRKAFATAKTYARYEKVTADFLGFLGKERAEAPLSAITREEVAAFRNTLLERGLAPETVETVIEKDLSAPFTAAHRLGYLTVNPCTGLEEPPPLPAVKPPAKKKAAPKKKPKPAKAKAKPKQKAPKAAPKPPPPAPEPEAQLSFGF